MRLGVLDIGSNTGHLLVVDAHDGAAPLPAYSHKEPLRLAVGMVPVELERAFRIAVVDEDRVENRDGHPGGNGCAAL